MLSYEYDVPLEKAHFRGFYSEMIEFMRSFFQDALKANDSLSFAALTGCLRVSKESIFTGLHNLDKGGGELDPPKFVNTFDTLNHAAKSQIIA